MDHYHVNNSMTIYLRSTRESTLSLVRTAELLSKKTEAATKFTALHAKNSCAGYVEEVLINNKKPIIISIKPILDSYFKSRPSDLFIRIFRQRLAQ